MFQKRVDQVIARMKADGLKQILVSEPCSIYYLTGVDVGPGERLFALYLNDEGRKVLFLNTLFTVEQKDCEEIWYSDTDDSTSLLASVINSSETLGVDKDWTARFLIPLMEKCEGLKVVLGSKYVDDTRAIKDEKEIECMIENSQINDVVMERTRDFISEGMTEKQVEAFILEQYKLLGCQNVSFSPICSFGANGADPHHMPDDSVLKAGDSIVIDIGGRKDRYCSDMTRTYFCKEASDEYKKIHDIVRVANEKAEEIIRPGVRLCDIDLTARNYISSFGYGEYFTHRLGHFIGQTDHEFGDVSSTNTETVKPGMIFSIEPGIYLPEKMGVRVEDLVLVTEDGCVVLNKVDKTEADKDGIWISAANKEIQPLIDALENLYHEDLLKEDPLLSNERQIGLLNQAKEDMLRAKEAMDMMVEPDLIEIDIQAAHDHLKEILGEVHREDLLDTLFSKFCLGK